MKFLRQDEPELGIGLAEEPRLPDAGVMDKTATARDRGTQAAALTEDRSQRIVEGSRARLDRRHLLRGFAGRDGWLGWPDAHRRRWRRCRQQALERDFAPLQAIPRPIPSPMPRRRACPEARTAPPSEPRSFSAMALSYAAAPRHSQRFASRTPQTKPATRHPNPNRADCAAGAEGARVMPLVLRATEARQ